MDFLYQTVVRFFSMLLKSVHGTAFLLGATVYISYAGVLALRLRSQSPSPSESSRRKPESERRKSSKRRRLPYVYAGLIGVSILILVGIVALSPAVDEESTCPIEDEGALFEMNSTREPQKVEPKASVDNAQSGPRMNGFWKRNWRAHIAAQAEAQAEVPSPPVMPTQLLSQAKEALEQEEASNVDSARPLLEGCAAWWKPGHPTPAITELQAQLECNAKLVEKGMTTQEASAAVVTRAKEVLEAVRSHSEGDQRIKVDAQVGWARVVHGAFQMKCKAISTELQGSRRTKGADSASSPTERRGLFALRALRRLNAPLRQSLDAVASATEALGPQDESPDAVPHKDLQDLKAARSADLACALRTVQEGRSVATALPRNSAHVRRALQCSPDMLVDFEAFVLKEAEKDTDAGVVFGLGLYWSDIGTAGPRGGEPLFFSARPRLPSSWSSEWSRDLRGYHAPADIVRAEEYLLQGLKASSATDVAERGAAHALRLYQHAKLLALKHHDAAAEWRYRAAAQLASKYRRNKLASHSMARLSYFLSLRGRLQEALAASDDALSRGVDPLAKFLQASLRCKLGELRTEKDVCAAEEQLGSVAGQLPSEALERQREATHNDLAWWRTVATGGIRVCFNARDAAQFLVCIFCSIIFTQPNEESA